MSQLIQIATKTLILSGEAKREYAEAQKFWGSEFAQEVERAPQVMIRQFHPWRIEWCVPVLRSDREFAGSRA